MRAIEGFEHRPTHHCVTGSMRDVYAFHGCDVSEDMLLGLGEGVGAAYFCFMLSRFLREAHAMGSGDALGAVAGAFEAIAEDWDSVALASRAAGEEEGRDAETDEQGRAVGGDGPGAGEAGRGPGPRDAGAVAPSRGSLPRRHERGRPTAPGRTRVRARARRRATFRPCALPPDA